MAVATKGSAGTAGTGTDGGTSGGAGRAPGRNVIDAASYFKPIAISDIPKVKRGFLPGRENKWGAVVQAFLDSGEQAVKLNLPVDPEREPEKVANSVQGAIRANLKKSGMPAVVVRRGADVILLRADINLDESTGSGNGTEPGGLTE